MGGPDFELVEALTRSVYASVNKTGLGLQRSVSEWAIRQGWGGRPVRQEQAQGILIGALGMLAMHFGYEKAARS